MNDTAVGTADSESEPFTPRRRSSGHGFRLRFRPDRAIEKAIAAKVLVKRDDEAGKRRPYLDRLIPIREPGAAGTAGQADDGLDGPVLVDRGDFARLEGSLLGFEQSDDRLGVFFEPLHGAAYGESGFTVPSLRRRKAEPRHPAGPSRAGTRRLYPPPALGDQGGKPADGKDAEDGAGGVGVARLRTHSVETILKIIIAQSVEAMYRIFE